MRTRTPGPADWARHPLMRVGAWAIACVVAVLPPIPSPWAAGAPAVPDLMKALDLAGYAPGERPPEFTGRTLEGRAVSPAALRGRVVLVSFWATWCLPCKEEMPVFERLHRDFAAQGLTILGINVREEPPAIRAYAKELGLTFPLVLDPEGKIQALYGVIGLPTTFLVGRDGRAVARAIGSREWGSAEARALVQALLASPAAGTRAR